MIKQSWAFCSDLKLLEKMFELQVQLLLSNANIHKRQVKTNVNNENAKQCRFYAMLMLINTNP